jgi:hypothetical protein
MDPITIAMGLAQFAPSLVKWITGSDKAESAAQKAIDIAKVVTGAPTGDAALAALQADPNLVLKYRQAVLDQELEFQRLAVTNAGDINKTMQAEAASEHWPSYSWRPAIGFAVALSILACAVTVVVAYTAAMVSGETRALEFLPGMLAAMAGVIGVASPILGIASWFRGKMQADPAVPTVNRG